jgi:FAD:protein FMN transferase
MGQAEVAERFDCFGSSCAVVVTGSAAQESAADAASLARRRLEGWHERFSRFTAGSELSRLNDDPRWEVPTSLLMARFAQAVHVAGSLSDGLVDATLVDQIETAGYVSELSDPVPLATALELAPTRKPGGGARSPHWAHIEVDLATLSVTRPPGVKLDSGGLAKGLFADVLAESLAAHPRFAINCGGDLAIGGAEGVTRPIKVESPFDGRTLHTFNLQRVGVATSGIGKRSWIDEHGRPAHHLLDPATGTPAFTGIVQVTALAPSALIAEIHAKAAILSGPEGAAAWLPRGGVIVFDDGSHQVLEPPAQ